MVQLKQLSYFNLLRRQIPAKRVRRNNIKIGKFQSTGHLPNTDFNFSDVLSFFSQG